MKQDALSPTKPHCEETLAAYSFHNPATFIAPPFGEHPCGTSALPLQDMRSNAVRDSVSQVGTGASWYRAGIIAL